MGSTSKSKKTRIIFLTNEEHGQSNVHLTVSSTLISTFPDQVDVLLCSFGKLEARCPEGVTFHKLEGEGMVELYTRLWKEKNPGVRPAAGLSFSHRPTSISLLRAQMDYKNLLIPWSEEAYLRTVLELQSILSSLQGQPDGDMALVAVIDPLFCQGIDACDKLGIRAMTLSPLNWNMAARATGGKENKDFILSWPSVGTGYPYPIPWYLSPLNFIHLIFFAIWLTVLSPGFRRLNKARAEAGYDRTTPFCRVPYPLICPGTMALDLPGKETDKIVPVGPIVAAYPPLSQVDPELDQWLGDVRGGDLGAGRGGNRARTILISLGSHFKFDAREVLEMMRALADVLDQRKDLQVLWKLIPDSTHVEVRPELDALIKRLEGRLRVVQWLKVDPACLLAEGKIAGYMHHGGANSYHEAVAAGVPHVIIAGWADCYDFAQRATELGLGVWANQAEAPSISTSSIRSAIFRVLGTHPDDTIARQYAIRAQEAARISKLASSMPTVPSSSVENGKQEELEVVRAARKSLDVNRIEGDNQVEGEVEVNGRDVAAEYILKWAQTGIPTVWGC